MLRSFAFNEARRLQKKTRKYIERPNICENEKNCQKANLAAVTRQKSVLQTVT